jgi:peroxiredoxin Q/BCP
MRFPFELGSDPDHAVAAQFGVWKRKKLYGRTMMGIERSTFLIDARGNIRREWRKVRVKGHAAEVLEAAKEL